MSPDALERLFAPESIGVVGVGSREDSTGRGVCENLRRFGFKGPLTAVGRKPGAIGDVEIATSIDACAGVEMLVVAVPSEDAVATVEAGLSLGIPSYVVLSAGFAEAGREGGEAQTKLRALVSDAGAALLGPNTVGYVNYKRRIDAQFSPWWVSDAAPGPVALISQSGGTAGSIWELANDVDIRFSYLIGTGNEAALDVVDALDFVMADEDVRIVALYVEGLRRGREFLRRLVALHDSGRQAVILSAGRSGAGARAALSHTASVAIPGQVRREILETAGAIVVRTPQEVVGAMSILSSPRPLPKRGNVMICADAGGSGVLAADLAEDAGLAVPSLPQDIRRKLEETIPPFGSADNPLDPTPVGRKVGVFPEILKTALSADNVDAGVIAGAHDVLRTAEVTAEALQVTDKYAFVVWTGGSAEIARCYRDIDIPYFDDARLGIESWQRVIAAKARDLDPVRTALRAAYEVPSRTAAGTRRVLHEGIVETSLRDRGIRVLPFEVATTASDASGAAHRMGFPVVLKALGSAVPHRASVGAMSLDVGDEQSVEQEFGRIRDVVTGLGGDLDGILVQKQMRPSTEAFVGIQLVAGFGPVVSIGLGGRLVGSGGTTSSLMPLDTDAVRHLVERSASLKQALSAGETQSFIEIVVGLCAWWNAYEAELSLAELDINPVMFDRQGAVVADALGVSMD